jgi:hypothetical protein
MAVAASALLGACGGNDKSVATTTRLRPRPATSVTTPRRIFEVTLRTTATPVGARVEGTTNLPNGTALVVSAQRAFLASDETEAREAHLAGAPARVANGAFSADLAFDNAILLVGVDESAHHQKVSPVADICAEVRTGRDFDGNEYQTKDVRAIIGDRGEALKDSPSATVFGSKTATPAYFLQVRVELNYPPPIEEYRAAQGTPPAVEHLDGFCVS